MADKITDEERALIDAAIERGMTVVVPQGTSGLPLEPMSWREATNRTFAALKRKDELKATPFTKSADSLTVEERIRRLCFEGKSNAAIGRELSLSSGAVAQRLFRMGIVRKNRKAGDNVPFGE